MKIPFKANLDGKVAVVTGGGGVLCSLFARALAQSGARVAVLGRTLSSLEAVVNIIKQEGGEALAVRADVTDKLSLIEAHEAVLKALGKCDILINGAGGNHPQATTGQEFFVPLGTSGYDDEKSLFDLTPEGINGVFNLNFTGTLLTTQVFAPDLIEKKDGVIINISSMNALRPLTKIPAYSAAKAAVGNLTQWLAVYFAKSGVRVNAIAPGFFVTEQNRPLLLNEDGSFTPRAEKILAATPYGRFGEPEELIGTLLFLADKASSGFITGITIPVDGGFSSYAI